MDVRYAALRKCIHFYFDSLRNCDPKIITDKMMSILITDYVYAYTILPKYPLSRS